LRRPGCQLQVVCQWDFWVDGAILWWRLLVQFIHWWRVLRVWYLVMWWRLGRLVGVVLAVQLLKRRLLPLLLLAKDLDGVLELRKSCSFSVNMLSSGFCMLNYWLPPLDGFLFLTEPLDLLLDSRQLLLFYSFIFKGFIFPVLHLDLLEVYILLNDLNWRTCSQRLLVRGTSIGLG
jgi:hypothetical protein